MCQKRTHRVVAGVERVAFPSPPVNCRAFAIVCQDKEESATSRWAGHERFLLISLVSTRTNLVLFCQGESEPRSCLLPMTFDSLDSVECVLSHKHIWLPIGKRKRERESKGEIIVKIMLIGYERSR